MHRRGSRRERWERAVHPGWRYDFEVDTSVCELTDECAAGDRQTRARRSHFCLRGTRYVPRVKPITVIVTASGAPGTAALSGAARERRARGAARRHRHERAVGRAAPLRRVPSRPGRLGSGVPRRDARRRRRARAPTRSCRSRRSTSRVSPAHVERFRRCRCSCRRPTRSSARTTRRRPTRSSIGIGLAGAGVPAGARRGGGRGGGARARLPRAAGVLQAGVLVRLARVPHPRPDRRPRAISCCASGPGRSSMRLEDAVEILASVDDRHGAARDGARGGRRSGRSTASRTGARSCSAIRRRARRCAPGSRCTS